MKDHQTETYKCFRENSRLKQLKFIFDNHHPNCPDKVKEQLENPIEGLMNNNVKKSLEI